MQRFLQHQNKILEARAKFCKVDDAVLDELLDLMMDDRMADDSQEDEEEDEDAHYGGADFQDCDDDTRRFALDVDEIGVSRGDLPTLSASVAHSMSVVLRDFQVVITDKISMVSGQTMLEKINIGLRDMFCSTKPFSGESLLLFGNFLQITQVPSVQLYSLLTANQYRFTALFGTKIWNLFSAHTVD